MPCTCPLRPTKDHSWPLESLPASPGDPSIPESPPGPLDPLDERHSRTHSHISPQVPHADPPC